MTKWKIQGRNGSLHISKRHPTNYMECLENAGKTVSQNKRSTGRVSHPSTSPVGRRGVQYTNSTVALQCMNSVPDTVSWEVHNILFKMCSANFSKFV